MSGKANIRIREAKSAALVLGWVATMLLGLAGIARGHSDPWGDVHPKVTVMDGKFSVVFNSTRPEEETDYSEEKPVQRMIFNVDGTLFAPRHPLERKRPWNEDGMVGIYGRRLPIGDSVLVFEGGRSAKPGYVLESPGGKLSQVRLPWPETVFLSLFEDVVVTPDGIAITGKEKRNPLMFYWFSHEETKAPVILTVGETVCIYDFPIASNIVFAGGKFWVAYMPVTSEENAKVALWSWNPGEKDGRVESLDAPAYGNSHMSMAAIGDQLCLAYHCAIPAQNGYEIARIATVFHLAK